MTAWPALTGWDSTKDTLHRTSQVIAAFRKAFSPKMPNALHLSLYIRPFGLTTGPLYFGHIDLDLAVGDLYVTVGDELWTVDLRGHSPKSLHDTLVNGLHQRGIDGDLPANTDAVPFRADPALANDYIAVLWRITGVMRELRADWLGAVTPLVVWPHGFDASQLWFPGANPDEHSQPHLNFGFSPGSVGLPRPYLYAYAYPMPDDLVGADLPPTARWHTQGWTGVIIDYDQMVTRPTQDGELAETLRAVFALLSARLGK